MIVTCTIQNRFRYFTFNVIVNVRALQPVEHHKKKNYTYWVNDINL